ncbi:sulfate adenylyltransferase subunit CysD [Streptomyces sp900116325]|uniref:sulfate adenylyltransferase subunit CysD n=1 Tax=Streptomyces sp. 900116325 TaxID=3154295 RepID=UPI0033C9F1E1
MTTTATAAPAAATTPAAPCPLPGGLQALEDEAVHILREVAGQFERPVLLFSGGKDSALVLHLMRKAFLPEALPFPLLHIDTGHNFPEVLSFRDLAARAAGARLLVARVQDSIDSGRVRERPDGLRNTLQSTTLLDALSHHRFDAVIGGARRDEDRARAKERVFSLRDEFGQWNPRRQRPELWHLYNGRHQPGEHVRVFPLSNWTELNVWRYIAHERIALPSLYLAHTRRVVRRADMWLAEYPHLTLRAGERYEERTVHYRTVGDVTCTGAVESTADDYARIVTEVATSRTTERGATRADDRISQAAMEDRKREGYF